MEYYESNAYGKVCESAFGIDLKQLGMMTKAEMDLLLEVSAFTESSNVLEIGCGAGQIATYICKRTSASFTCVDVDKKAIGWAKKSGKDNTRLNYRELDVKNILEISGKYSKILAIDSLYFISDMNIDSFYDSLKTTVKNLYSLLDVGGDLAVFWSELPFFKPERKSPECTQLGICLQELGYAYQSFDLTDGEIAFWKNFKDALILYEEEFINEGSIDLLNTHIKEADFFIEYAENGRLYRNLYLIQFAC